MDYARDLHFFIPPEPGLVQPDPIGFRIRRSILRRSVGRSISRKGADRASGVAAGTVSKSRQTSRSGETILPVDDIVFFNPAGGRAIRRVSRQMDCTDATVDIRRHARSVGVGSVVGPGASAELRRRLLFRHTRIRSSQRRLCGMATVGSTALGRDARWSVWRGCGCGPLANPAIHPALRSAGDRTGTGCRSALLRLFIR